MASSFGYPGPVGDPKMGYTFWPPVWGAKLDPQLLGVNFCTPEWGPESVPHFGVAYFAERLQSTDRVAWAEIRRMVSDFRFYSLDNNRHWEPGCSVSLVVLGCVDAYLLLFLGSNVLGCQAIR